MRSCPTLLAVLTVLAASTPLAAIEPDEVRIRVSVKRVKSPSDALPTGRYGSASEITRVISKSNVALAQSGASWTLVLTGIDDAPAASSYYVMSAGELTNLEADAKADTAGFFWLNDAINMYVVDEITDAGGVCSFPAAGPHREVIVINSKGILGGSEGWLHEIGHYFNLIHTHEGDQVADTIFDPPLPSPYDCAVHDQSLLDQASADGVSPTDTYNGLHNIMGYHCDPLVFTPLQVIRMRRALLDYRLKVMEPLPPDGAPAAAIQLPPEAAGGIVSLAGPQTPIILDGAASDDGDGGKGLTWRWSLVSGPSGGARFTSPASGWARGCTGIGYGDEDDLTRLPDMQNRYLTVYLTRELQVANPANLTYLELDIAYDDGFAAYLNGTEVARRNLPAGAGRDTSASTSGDARDVLDLSAFLGALVPGRNRLSMEIHNAGLSSSDLSMHPVLYAGTTGGSRITLIPSRAVWYYRKGSAGDPPADWMDPGFDAGASRVAVAFSLPGAYRFRLAVDDGLPPDNMAQSEVSVTVIGGGAFVRGDCNFDGSVDVSDPVRGLLHLFAGGRPLPCPDACDTDDTETLAITDSIVLLDFLFRSGPPPAAPFPAPGLDAEGEDLDCGE